MQRYSDTEIFISSDNLDDLDILFDIVCTLVEIQHLNKQIKKVASQLSEAQGPGGGATAPMDEQMRQ